MLGLKLIQVSKVVDSYGGRKVLQIVEAVKI